MYIVTITPTRPHLKFDRHAKEIKPYVVTFPDKPSALRFAQHMVECDRARCAKVEED